MDSHINRPKAPYFGALGIRRLSKQDYVLLGAMLVVSIPVGHWVMPWLVPGTSSSWILEIATVLISVLSAAYIWQIPMMSRLFGILELTVVCAGLYLFAWPSNLQDHVISATCAINLGVWSYIRYAIQFGSAQRESVQ